VEKKYQIGDFSYISQERRDPFEPILLKVKKSNISKSGYELEELRLAGIIKKDSSWYAMMEDVQGRGIVFKKGDFLNNNLWIFDILEGKVIFAYRVKKEIRKFSVDIPKKKEGM
jgi:Tfp pilus assembly protein PilP